MAVAPTTAGNETTTGFTHSIAVSQLFVTGMRTRERQRMITLVETQRGLRHKTCDRRIDPILR